MKHHKRSKYIIKKSENVNIDNTSLWSKPKIQKCTKTGLKLTFGDPRDNLTPLKPRIAFLVCMPMFFVCMMTFMVGMIVFLVSRVAFLVILLASANQDLSFLGMFVSAHGMNNGVWDEELHSWNVGWNS